MEPDWLHLKTSALNSSLTCQHQDKETEDKLSLSSTFLHLPVLKDIQSRAQRQLRRRLSACPVTVSRAQHGDEHCMFVSDPGPWSALLHRQVLPLLTAPAPPPPPPPSGRQRAFHSDKERNFRVGWEYFKYSLTSEESQKLSDSLDIDDVEHELSYQIFEVPLILEAFVEAVWLYVRRCEIESKCGDGYLILKVTTNSPDDSLRHNFCCWDLV